MCGNPCLAKAGTVLVSPPTASWSFRATALCPDQLSEYRSDLYLGEET